jgi:hypothetical protein
MGVKAEEEALGKTDFDFYPGETRRSIMPTTRQPSRPANLHLVGRRLSS